MDNELLIPRINDAVRLSDASGMPKFVGFLNAEESAEVLQMAKRLNCRFSLFGGYDSAERVVFGVYPDWCEDESVFCPVSAVTFTFRKQDKLTHRDFLGALMSLGITRESVGDILIEEGRAVVFLINTVLQSVLNGIGKVANAGVTPVEGFNEPLPCHGKTQDISDTVASARLDCVVSALLNCSRNEANELIHDRAVSINSICVEKSTRTVVEGDKITVRRKGKFVIESVSDRTRKDRIVLKAKKYI